MRCSWRSAIYRYLPLVFSLVTVLAGFSLLIVLQHQFKSERHGYEKKLQSASTKKDLGELIDKDLSRIATYFYMLLVSVDRDYQESLLREVETSIEEVDTALSLLEHGGGLIRTIPLNLPDKSSFEEQISYRPEPHNGYGQAVLALRPQVVELENKIRQVLKQTEQRNRLFRQPGKADLKAAGIQLRHYAQEVDSQVRRMVEQSNRLVYEATLDLAKVKRLLAEQERKKHPARIPLGGDHCAVGFFLYGVDLSADHAGAQRPEPKFAAVAGRGRGSAREPCRSAGPEPDPGGAGCRTDAGAAVVRKTMERCL